MIFTNNKLIANYSPNTSKVFIYTALQGLLKSEEVSSLRILGKGIFILYEKQREVVVL